MDGQIIYIPEDYDDDERNARASVGDHRSDSSRAVVVSRPGRPASRAPKQVVITSSRDTRQPVVVHETVAVAPSVAPGDKKILGNFTVAEAAEFAGQALGALAPLPVPPVATGKVDVDVENLTLFHNAVATHFKRDERIRLAFTLIARLLS